MKIMAIDYGDAHTGIAISDATGTLAGFTTVIDSLQGGGGGTGDPPAAPGARGHGAGAGLSQEHGRHRGSPCREGRCLRRDAAAGGTTSL